MRIAIDTRFLTPDTKPGIAGFTRQVFYLLATLHREHEFIFISDHTVTHEEVPPNISYVSITPAPTNFLLYKWWFDLKLPLALKKLNAEVFVATDAICSLKSVLPQVLLIRDLAFLRSGSARLGSSERYCKRYLNQFLKKAERVATLSDFIREELNRTYQIPLKNIEVLGSGPLTSCAPQGWEQREVSKEKFAAGCEYFVVTGISGENFLTLLKGFSIFKKWQKTNLKLVLLSKEDRDLEKNLDKLNTYKYRGEVLVERDLSQADKLEVISGSYAVIFFSDYEGFAYPVLQAMLCEVALITCANSSISEIAGNAALYTDPTDPANIAEQMKRIYKDEQLRSRLISDGKLQSARYNWQTTAQRLWEVIELAVSK